MENPLREAHRQAQEHLFSRGQRISTLDGRIRYNETFFIRDGEAPQISEFELESVIFGRLIFPSNLERRDFADKILRAPGLSAILLIILASGTYSMVEAFEQRLLRQHPPCTHSDRDLPFSRVQANDIFGEEGPEFFLLQSEKDAIKLVEGNFDQAFDMRHRLPYLSSAFLGDGAYGEVHKVEIERGHYTKIDGVVSFSNSEVLSLARKDFEPDQHSYASFQAENNISQTFHIANPPPSISKVLCSITIKVDNHTFPVGSLFSEPASLDLKVYLTKDRTEELSLDERIHNLQQMLHICHGLKWLNHEEKRSLATGKYENASYIHGDLKPENIFIYHDPQAVQALQGAVFKMGDFGDAYLLSQSKQDDSTRRPPDQFFRIGTYRAPEIQQGKVDTKSDVWSFGCILLLVLLYNHQESGGPSAVRSFGRSRAQETGNDNEDVFYQTKRTIFQKDKIGCNKAVIQCIKNMISYNKQSKSPYAKIATEILGYIKLQILVPESSRASIRDVYERLRHIMNGAVTGMPEDRVLTPAKYQLEFPDSKSGSYCRHSPNGRVFYYSPKQITIYGQDGTALAEIKKKTTVDTKLKWSDRVPPNSRACGISAICIIQKSATNDLTQLSIEYFDRKKDPITVQLAEVNRLNGVALSPNEQFVAVACDPNKDERLSARVRMYRVSDFQVLSAPPRSHTGSSGKTYASNSSFPLIQTQNDQIKHGEVRDILPGGHVDLVFSKDEGTLYHAHRTRKHQVVVSMWNIDGSFLAKSIVEDNYINDPRIFVTEIVPLFDVRGFVAITHEQHIIQRQWKPDTGWTKEKTSQVMINSKAILGLKTILVANDNLRVVILATNDRNILKCYEGSLRDDMQPRELTAKDDIQYSPEQDSAYLSKHEDGRLELQVASKRKNCIFTYHLD